MSVIFHSVSVSFGARHALRGLSAEIPAGAVTGIVGPNGAGKTTMLRVALGLQPLAQGTVTVHGKQLQDWRREGLARAMAYLPQAGEARWPMTVADVVLLGRLPHRARLAPPSLADQIAVADALERCDATRFAARRMDELSAGERARVLFARALATGAGVLLADEPAAYLDPSHQIGLMELLQAEARRGTAVAVTLHDLPLAGRHCDRILVLQEGALAAAGPPEVALADDTLAAVFRIARIGEGLAAFRRL
jgi:iron complex transport system ATP-binding protein